MKGICNLWPLSIAVKGDEGIRPVLWLLVGMKGICNLWPLRISVKGDEGIRLVVVVGWDEGNL